ncbi:hypothetical protein [Fischerella sp.]|nr:hypothetical protein [Fischerella sp.]
MTTLCNGCDRTMHHASVTNQSNYPDRSGEVPQTKVFLVRAVSG